LLLLLLLVDVVSASSLLHATHHVKLSQHMSKIRCSLLSFFK
jgi:hypothetical protein